MVIFISKFVCRDNINNNNMEQLANIINNNFKDRIILPKNNSNVLNTPISNLLMKKNMII